MTTCDSLRETSLPPNDGASNSSPRTSDLKHCTRDWPSSTLIRLRSSTPTTSAARYERLRSLSPVVRTRSKLPGSVDAKVVYDTLWIGLDVDRTTLYRRIDDRVDRMVALGLLDEIRTLLDGGFRAALTASQAIGYKEFVPVIESGADLDEAVASVKQATRRYAKRQLTWFRSDPRLAWIDVAKLSLDDTVSHVAGLLESAKTE